MGKQAIAGVLIGVLLPRRGVNPLNFELLFGILLGSVGLFIFKALYVSRVPQWPLQLLGSSIPELGGALWEDATLNPVFAIAQLWSTTPY